MSALNEVRGYYDANTARFERFGQGQGTLHRAVWGEGVGSRNEAFRYVDELIWRELTKLAVRDDTTHVLDLGCGVGSSLAFLASRGSVRGTGATLSGVQARRARERGIRTGLADRVRFIEADFLALPSDVPKAHLAFSIEAFVHGLDPAAYFAAAARYLHPGGFLVVCDDFVTPKGGAPSPPEARWLREVRTCWLANTLVGTEEASELARQAGFELCKNLDLTPYLELGRARDRLISWLVGVGRHLPLGGFGWRSLVGGNALQRSLESGLIEYRFLVWQLRGGRAHEAPVP
jgi:cyclopropane fatty-acyl-phospholipid synthase-like methyltransferase